MGKTEEQNKEIIELLTAIKDILYRIERYGLETRKSNT